MSISISLGLDILLSDNNVQSLVKGRVAYLCHSASLDKNLINGVEKLKELLGDQLVALFGPQHGFVTDVQDNMIETTDTVIPYFNLPVFSLYGETRVPTDKMLEGIDTLIIDLQDVGTRVYTYITSLGLCIEACEKKGIRVIVLDRPNPAGPLVEGPVLDLKWKSFVGHHPIPQRHGLTFAEVALLQKKLYTPQSDLHIVAMKNYHRNMTWQETGLTWVNPSPNLSTPQSCLVFPGTVLFEGTNISEGRGTTRALEIIGAPGIEPYSFRDQVQERFEQFNIEGITAKAHFFLSYVSKVLRATLWRTSNSCDCSIKGQNLAARTALTPRV